MQHSLSPKAPDPRVRWRRARWDEPGTVYFWSGRGGQFESFSNFALTPFSMASWQNPSQLVSFASGEHAFQAAKATTGIEHDRIRLAPTPLAARRLGRQAQLPAGWDRRRGQVMLAVLRAKFAVPELAELLLSTGERLLRRGLSLRPRLGMPRSRRRKRRPEPSRASAHARPRRAPRSRRRRGVKRERQAPATQVCAAATSGRSRASSAGKSRRSHTRSHQFRVVMPLRARHELVIAISRRPRRLSPRRPQCAQRRRRVLKESGST